MKTIKTEVTREYNKNGQLSIEEYRLEGKRHNPNGPAFRGWYADGQLSIEEYWINDKQLTKEEFNNRIEVNGKKYILLEIV